MPLEKSLARWAFAENRLNISETAVVMVLTLLAYLPALRGSVVWDDPIVLEPAALAAPLGRKMREWAWLRLISRMSWKWVWLLSQRFPMLPHWQLQHTTSVLLHIGTAVATVPLAVAIGANPLIVALTMGLHPLATGATAAMGQRASVLGWLFVLLGLNCLLWFGAAGVILTLMLWTAALLSKEDSLGVVGLLGLFTRFRAHATTFADLGLVAAKIETRLPLREHFPLAVVGSLERLPFWFFGAGQSVEHRRPVADWMQTVAILWVALGIAVAAIWLGHWELVRLFVLSPLVLYWFFPTAHIVTEARAYATVTIFALIAGLLPFTISVPLLLLWSVQTAFRAWLYADPIRYWCSALKRGTPFTVWTSLAAALQAAGQLDEASKWNARIIDKFPLNGIAYVNQALIEQARAIELYNRAGQALEQTGCRGDEYAKFYTTMQLSCQLIIKGQQLNPEDPQIRWHHDYVLGIAKQLRVQYKFGIELLQ